jgi:hypothetical protein
MLNHSYKHIHTYITHRLDTIGSFLSLACALHCFLTPLALVLFPTVLAHSFGHSHDSSLHTLLVVASLLLATLSLVIGHRKHENYNLFVLPVVSSLLFYFSHDTNHESVTFTIAGLILVATHLLNKRLCNQCPTCKH